MENRMSETQWLEKTLDDKPAQQGEYNISIQNVYTFLPLFLKFDGENWIGLDEINILTHGDLSRVTYYDKIETVNKVKPKI